MSDGDQENQLVPHDTAADSVSSAHGVGNPVRSHLFVVLECDRPLAGGARYSLEGVEKVVIGRGRERSAHYECSNGLHRLKVLVPGARMSAIHATITKVGADDWELVDNDSTNGVQVNGRSISRSILADGDCFQLGRTIFTIRKAQPTPLQAPTILDFLIDKPQTPGLATLNPGIAKTYDELTRIAVSDLPVVLSGDTGTGKEVIAQALHRLSGRKGPFVAVNCGALPAVLIESLLFGHVKGAFSGSIRDEVGFVRSAEGGTLFLDEIAELPRSSQVVFLRVLQESEVVPLGSPRSHKVDVRVIAAAQRPLYELVGGRDFREDLRARLEGHSVHLAPLAQRREDLGIIIAAILGRLCDCPPPLHPHVGRLFWQYDWPLNIRELEMVLRHAIALATGGGPIQQHQLPAGLGKCDVGMVALTEQPAPLSSEDLELRTQVEHWLRIHQGNISEVARATGKARTQIQRWMRKFHLRADDYRH